MTPADLRLYGWLLARPSTAASVVAELSGTAEERTLQRVHEDLRALVEAGRVTHEAGGLVWCEARCGRSVVERIADLLRIGPMSLSEIARTIGATFPEVKTALVRGAFRERSLRWHLAA